MSYLNPTHILSGLEAHAPEDLNLVEWDVASGSFVTFKIDGEYCGIPTVEVGTNDLEFLRSILDRSWYGGDTEALNEAMSRVKTVKTPA